MPRKPAAPAGSATVHLIGNAHIDPVWLWRWQEGFAETKATFQAALDRMDETPDYIFTASSAALYAWVEANDPAMFARIRARVDEGRWALAGGWWIEPDCNVPAGESLVRQGLYGQRYFRSRFGRTCRVGYCVDTFGHPATLPKLLAGCGLEGYVFMRPQAHENPQAPALALRWQGDDGTRIVALRIPRTYGVWSDEALQREIEHAVALAPQTPLGATTFAFYGVGNHGGGPTRQMLAAITRWQRQADGPRLRHSDPEQLLAAVAALPLKPWQGELQHHARGCYAAVSAIKTGNRAAEEALLAAERWGLAAAAAAARPPATAALATAWQHLLFNQFHDILAGSSVAEAYVDAGHQLGAAIHAAETEANAARQTLTWQIDTRGEALPLVAFNNQPFPFTGVIETEDVGFLLPPPAQGELGLTDAAGRPVPSQAIEPHTICGRRRFVACVPLPALGYAVLRQGIVPTGAARRALGRRAVRVQGHTLTNERLRLSLDDQGYLSLYDRQRQVRVLARGGGGIPLLLADRSDTWSHGVAGYRDEIGRLTVRQVEVLEGGPVRGCLRVTFGGPEAELVLDYLLGADEGFVTVRGQVHWRAQWQVLKLAFPVSFTASRWTAEVPYGTVTRTCSGDEEPVQQWVDLSAADRGLAVANDGRYSCSVEPDQVRVTLLRSPAFAFHDPFKPPSFAQHRFTDQGVQDFQLALLPHAGDWRDSGIIEVARQLNRPPDTLSETYHAGPLPPTQGFITCRGRGIYIGAAKGHEDGLGYIVRAAEWFGRRQTAQFAIPALGRQWRATFGPGQIKTFLVPANADQAVREVNLLED